jgi:hypothetical protein
MIHITKHIKLFHINKCIKFLLSSIHNNLNLYILFIVFQSIYIKVLSIHQIYIFLKIIVFFQYKINYKYNINYIIKIVNLLSKCSIILRIE